MLVLGGQAADEPDMLTQLALAQGAAGKTMPWFGNIRGHALVCLSALFLLVRCAVLCYAGICSV